MVLEIVAGVVLAGLILFGLLAIADRSPKTGIVLGLLIGALCIAKCAGAI